MNLLTVKTGSKYTSEDVNRLVRLFFNHHAVKAQAYCITDNPEGLDANITPIKPSLDAVGWWSKINLFAPDMPEGLNIYFDLDTVICGSLYRVIIEKHKGAFFLCSEDPWRWCGCRFGSAFMVWEGDYSHVYEHFKANSTDIINNTQGGDQAYLATQIEPIYLEDKEPKLVASYKRDIEPLKAIPKGAGLLNFHGKPKPVDILKDGNHFLHQWLCKQYGVDPLKQTEKPQYVAEVF